MGEVEFHDLPQQLVQIGHALAPRIELFEDKVVVCLSTHLGVGDQVAQTEAESIYGFIPLESLFLRMSFFP